MATRRKDTKPQQPIFPAPEDQSQSMSAQMMPEMPQMQAMPTMPTVQPAQLMGMDDGREASGGLEPAATGLIQRPYRSRITKEILDEAMRVLRQYKAGKKSTERRIVDAQQWWKLRNWEEIEKNGVKGSHSSKSNTAWLWNCIVGKHADAIDSYPEPVVLPRMEDDKDEAKILSEIVPVVMAQNGFEQTYNDAAWQKMTEGTGAYGVFWDREKLNGLGDISITRVNLLNLFWEPGVNDIQDSKNLFHVALMDNDVLQQIYPQLRGQQLGGDKFVTEYRYDDNIDTTNKSLVIDWYYHGYAGKRKILHYCKFVGEHVLYCTEDNPETVERGLYDDGLYPFVLDPLFPIEGSPAGFGYIHVGKDTQQDIDLISQAVVTNAVLNATPRFFIRKDGAVNEQEFADTTKPFVHVNGQLGQDTILPVNPPNMPGNVMDVLMSKIDELKFVTGNTDVSNGGVPSGVTAASAIAALREESGRSSKDSNKAAYRAYARIVTMVIERIRQFYDMPRKFRIVGADGSESFVTYSNKGLAPQAQGDDFGIDMGYRVPTFDLDIRAQRENAYTRASQNELAIQLYQLGVFNPQTADQSVMMLDMMDFKGKDELITKVRSMGAMAQAFQQIAQIASQMALQSGNQQTAVMIQQIAAAVAGGAAPAGLAAPGGMTMPQGDATGASVQPEKHPFVERAEEQIAQASRPE